MKHNKTINIVVLSPLGTPKYRTFLIAKRFRELGYTVNINTITFTNKIFESTIYEFKINYYTLPDIFKYNKYFRWFYILFILPFIFLIKNINFDILFITDVRLLPLAYISKILFRKRIIYDSMELFIFGNPGQNNIFTIKLFKLLEKLFIKFVDIVYVVDSHKSFWANRYLQKGCKTSVIFNVPEKNDIKTDILGKIDRRNLDKISLVYVGGIHNGSGIINIIKSLKILPPKYRLIVIGEGDNEYKKKILDKIKNYGLEKRFSLIGWLSYEKLIEKISEYHIGIMSKKPSTSQYGYIGIGNSRKVFTYMHAGLPVIAPKYNSVALQVEKEGCGLRINIERPNDIARAVIKLSENLEFYQRLATKSIEAIYSKYNWEIEKEKLGINI
ncbi:MAG TPA: glycosyltransferase [Bacteroidales bacterium]|nr:glycosyltransferase [Bacteroidales bacterium]